MKVVLDVVVVVVVEDSVDVEVELIVVVVGEVEVVVLDDVLVEVVVVTRVDVVVLVHVLVVDVCRTRTVSTRVVVKFPAVRLDGATATIELQAVLFVVIVVAVVVTVVAELVVVLAEEIYPTVVVDVHGPEGRIIFPILFPTSSVKKTSIFP